MKNARPQPLFALAGWSGLFLTAIILLITYSCVPTITCEDIGCAYGYHCNPTTGECDPPVRDCAVTGCPSGQNCDEQRGICRPEAVSCRSQPCPRDQTCNTQTGFCEAASNCAIDGCPASETCDTNTGRCAPKACTADSQCPSSFVCGQNEQCVSGCRPGARTCAAGTYCRVLPSDPVGQCVPQCTRDLDCPYGQFCESIDGRASCQLEPPCQVDTDCRADEVCRDSTCTHPPCRLDADCQAPLVCDRSTGLCAGGLCDEDIFAPNQSQATAFVLPPGNYANVTICPGRADWFAIDVRSSDVVRFRIEHDLIPNLDLYLHDANGRVIRANQRLEPVSVIEHIAERSQRLYLRVDSVSFQESRYNLNIAINDGAFCLDDAFEENDTAAQASRLPTNSTSPTELPLRICGFDQDWFVLPQLAADIGLHVRFRNAPPGFQGRLLTPDGQVFEPTVGESLRIRRLGAGGDYFLQARNVEGRSGSYQLLYQVLQPWRCPGSGDRATLESARDVEEDSIIIMDLCPTLAGSWDVHWFRLATGSAAHEGGSVAIQILADPSAPDLKATLFTIADDQRTLLRTATRTADGSLALGLTVEEDRPLYLRVHSDTLVGRVIDAPQYRLLFRTEAP